MNNQIKLKVTGKNPNTYLKELIRENINLYNIKINNHFLEIIINQKDYEKVIKIKTSYKIEIIDYYGYSKIKHFFKQYCSFILIIGLCIIYINELSNRIFFIEVEHSNPNIIKIVKSDLKKYGIEKYKRKVSFQQKQKIKEKILEKEKDYLEWIEIEEIGTKYIVKVEQRKKNKAENKCLPRNIIAKKNAMILEIKASSGEIVKKKLDYVEKGEIIISGFIHNKEDIVEKKCSIGEIYGEVWYKVKVSIPKEKIIIKNEKEKSINLYFKIGRSIIFNNVKFKTYQKNEYNILRDSIIPIKLSININRKTTQVRKKYKEIELEKKALKYAGKEINKKLKAEEEVLSKKVLKKEEKNSKIIIDVFVRAKENITGYQDISKIDINELNNKKE